MSATYEPIATYTAPSAQGSYTFTSIPSTYTDLVVVVSGALNVAAACYVQFGNGSIDTGGNYSMTYLYGTGSSAVSGREVNATKIFAADFSTGQSNAIVNVQNYKNTTTYKTILCRGNAASVATSAQVGMWRSTSAINQINIFADASRTFNTGSTFTLYGIKAA
jgi:hypothetical protein